MLDIQSNVIKGPGKRVVDLEMMSGLEAIKARMSFDVGSDQLAHNVVPVTELVRNGLDAHFTHNRGHWIQSGEKCIPMYELITARDSYGNERFLFAVKVKILSPLPEQKPDHCLGSLMVCGSTKVDAEPTVGKVGDMMRLINLKRNTEYNGLIVTLKQWHADKQRWEVHWSDRIMYRKANDQWVFAKIENLESLVRSVDDAPAAVDPEVFIEMLHHTLPQIGREGEAMDGEYFKEVVRHSTPYPSGEVTSSP